MYISCVGVAYLQSQSVQGVKHTQCTELSLGSAPSAPVLK